MLTKNYMYLQWEPELLRGSCGFDSRRERFSGNEDSFIAVFFMRKRSAKSLTTDENVTCIL